MIGLVVASSAASAYSVGCIARNSRLSSTRGELAIAQRVSEPISTTSSDGTCRSDLAAGCYFVLLDSSPAVARPRVTGGRQPIKQKRTGVAGISGRAWAKVRFRSSRRPKHRRNHTRLRPGGFWCTRLGFTQVRPSELTRIAPPPIQTRVHANFWPERFL